jgi:hypothetical protein
LFIRSVPKTSSPNPASYGIDAQAEVVADDDLVTGQLLALQIKGGRSWFRKPYNGGWTFYGDSNHLAYWLGHSLPVIVVIVDDDDNAFWEQVTPSTTSETPEGFALKIPSSQRLDATARDKLLAVAGRSKGLAASLPDFYAVLPPAAVGPVERAAGTSRLAAARLAERLAAGRAAPDATAALVIAGKPSWLVNSAAAQDLWLAVAGYAAEHARPRESSDAFALAADSPGPRSAKARALAGIQLIASDRDAARDLLRRARDEGETVLADVGLAAADVPDGDARPVDIPASLRDAPPDVVRAEPFLLNFLAEAALRRREFTETVGLREQAVAASGDGDSAYRLTLAEALRRRALSEPGNSGADLRRALGYAQAAVAERRRWSGPSADALGEVLDILTTAGDMSEVVTGRAAPVCGRHRTRSRGDCGRRRPARRARGAGLPQPGLLRLLHAAAGRRPLPPGAAGTRRCRSRADEGRGDRGLDTADRRSGRRRHDGPLRRRARPARGLALQADDLRARSLLPEAEYEALKAVCRAEAGEPDIGIARLRELSATSLIAADELVHLLEKHVGPDAAISEAEQQATRWQAPALQIQYVDLLGRHGRFRDAAAFIQRTIPDQSLPADVRVKLCGWYTVYQAREGRFAAAAATARSGLAVAADADLAWKLVTVLVSDGKLSDARQALDRYRLEPGSEQEIRLWMQLHLGVTVTADDAQVMISITGRLPDGEFRDAIIAMLIREAAVAKGSDTFPADLIAAIAQLEADTRNRPGTGLRIDPSDDTALRAALQKRVPDQAAYQKLLGSVQAGTACMADIAAFAERPYGTVLLHRPAGILPAADLAPGLRAAGEKAARQAVEAGACAADLSSLHLLGLLADDDRLRIRSALPSLTVARSAIDDALLTRDHVRNLSAATYTASLAPDGTIDRTAITTTEQALLRTRAETLETITESAHASRPATPAGAAADAVAVAVANQLPLWCDDIALRQKARIAGVAAFSLLDLITVLAADGTAFDQPATFRCLAGQYAVDLPLSAADITALAAAADWLPGPAHTALARPAWWRHHETGWEDTWLQVATQARSHSAEALTTITKAALTGALGHVSSLYVTQRYQQIAVLAVIACHDAGQPPPPGLLDELAQGAEPARVPQPPYVLAAVISALGKRGVPDPEETAMRLLPGTSLP